MNSLFPAPIHEGHTLSIWFGYYEQFPRSFSTDVVTDKAKLTVVLLFGSGVKRHVGKKACLFKSRGVKRHVVKSQSVNWHAVFRQSMKKGMFPLGLTRVDNIFS